MIGRHAIKTLSAMILCVCMIAAYMPLTVFAAEKESEGRVFRFSREDRIAKAACHPSNSRPIPQGIKVAVQINYAIGGVMDFSKDIPEIHTTAAGTDTKEHITYADKAVSITDVVDYSNLIPGKEYVMTGTLMDKETGKPITDGLRTVTASQTFTPEAADGQVELTFTFNGVKLAGREIVAFEECTADGVIVAVHADLNDEKQTVNIPEIGTTAAILDKTVTDTIRYENLVPGRTYVIRGWLMDTGTGKRIEGSEGSTRFEIGESETQSAVSGEINVELPVSGYDELRGRKVTAFEELYLVEQEAEDAETQIAETKDSGEEILVAEHKDLKCMEQTVEIPPAQGAYPETGDDPMIWLCLILFAGSFMASLTYVVRHVRNH